MTTDDLHLRMKHALAEADPRSAIYRLAVELRDAGHSQRELMELFGHYQQTIDGDDPLYEAVVDNMDLIHGGPWAKGGDLFATEYDPENDA